MPGPPKRFAEGIGATLSVTALVLHVGFGATGAAYVLVAMILVAATLESVFAYCLGCKIFAVLMRVGVIPESVCEECADIWTRAGVRRCELTPATHVRGSGANTSRITSAVCSAASSASCWPHTTVRMNNGPTSRS